MTNQQILSWIKNNLAIFINQAISEKPGILYTEDWLAAITCRETGDLIARYVTKNPGISATDLAALMRGDFTQRPGETQKQYHGYGYIQVDTGSFPAFISSGDWKDPLKCYRMAIAILEGKRKYLLQHFPVITGDSLAHYITAAYNCGEGHEAKAVTRELDPDAYTTGHNYSSQVWQFRDIYNSL